MRPEKEKKKAIQKLVCVCVYNPLVVVCLTRWPMKREKEEEEIHPFTSVSSRRARALSIERK